MTVVKVAKNPTTSFSCEANVGIDGRLELMVPALMGQRVRVFVVVDELDQFADLEQAAESSLDFWDNPLDDEDWNNA